MAIVSTNITGFLFYPDTAKGTSLTVKAQRLQGSELATAMGSSDTASAVSNSTTGAFALTVPCVGNDLPVVYRITLTGGYWFDLAVPAGTVAINVGNLPVTHSPVPEALRNITALVLSNAVALKPNISPTIVEKDDAFTVGADQNGVRFLYTANTNRTVTVDQIAPSALPLGFTFILVQYGSGTLTAAVGLGQTLNIYSQVTAAFETEQSLALTGQYSETTFTKDTATQWTLISTGTWSP